MCKTIEIRYRCGHPHSYALIEECHAGFFPNGILCGRQSTEIIGSVTLADYPFCITYCFNRMKLEFEMDYVLLNSKLKEDARAAGWTEADIKGSQMELKLDFEREINCLREICGAPKHRQRQISSLLPKSSLNADELRLSIPEPSTTSNSNFSPEHSTDGESVEAQPEDEWHDEWPDLDPSQVPCGGRLNPCGDDQCDGYHGHKERLRRLAN